MIGDLFLRIVFWFAHGLVSMFPDSEGFPQEAHAAASYIGGYFGMIEPLVPVGTLLTCLTIVFSVQISIFGFRTLKWVVSHLPLIGGRG